MSTYSLLIGWYKATSQVLLHLLSLVLSSCAFIKIPFACKGSVITGNVPRHKVSVSRRLVELFPDINFAFSCLNFLNNIHIIDYWRVYNMTWVKNAVFMPHVMHSIHFWSGWLLLQHCLPTWTHRCCLTNWRWRMRSISGAGGGGSPPQAGLAADFLRPSSQGCHNNFPE